MTAEAAPPRPAHQTRVLLATKLFVPRSRQALVDRPFLAARIERGRRSKLTLISAPAGFGKTTLAAVWAEQTEQPVAWLSLDEADNDPERFLAYLAGALQSVDAHLGRELQAALEVPQEASQAALLTGLVNEISARGEALALVLDDYHLIHEEAIHRTVRFLIDNSPDFFHLLICTREDPPWPLSRLRASGELCELRGRDLRFSRQETAVFCKEIMGLELSDEDIALLDGRAEGWIAGLQLAALSMQGAADLSRMVAAFSGSNRYVLDYLLEEVLERQPASLQTFLLQTAVLDRFCAPLCDALLAEDGEDGHYRHDLGPASQEMVEQLEAANLFIVPLDARRHWYRYHHLFRGLLRARLQRLHPQQITRLHRRAARWFAAEGYFEEAIAHALAAEDFDLAAGLLEVEGLELISRHKMVAMARWLERMPEAVFDQRPMLCVLMAYTRHWLGERQFALGARLDQADRVLAAAAELPDQDRRRIRGYIASLRAQNALSAGDLPAIIEQANLALELLPPGDLMLTEAAVSLGGAYWIQGDAPNAERAFASGSEAARRYGSTHMAVPTAVYTSWQRIKQGRLAEALELLETALSWATSENGQIAPIGGFPMLRISDLRYEWGDANAALEIARQGADLCRRLSQADVLVDAHATLACRLNSAGDIDGALEQLRLGEEAARNRRPDLFLLTRLDACRLRIWLQSGDLAAAQSWLAAEGPDPQGALSYHQDLHHLLAVRILLAAGRPEEALPLALRIADAARAARWVHEQIQALTLAAVAAQQLEDTGQAQTLLTAALRLGAPGRFLRSILDEGPLVGRLLRLITPQREIPQAYLDWLQERVDAAKPARPAPASQPLIEPLSERELEILALIAAGLSNQQIATRLVLSLATVKWHASNIYGKLGVANRSQAVIRARELNFLS